MQLVQSYLLNPDVKVKDILIENSETFFPEQHKENIIIPDLGSNFQGKNIYFVLYVKRTSQGVCLSKIIWIQQD